MSERESENEHENRVRDRDAAKQSSGEQSGTRLQFVREQPGSMRIATQDKGKQRTEGHISAGYVAVQAAHPRYTDPVFHYRLLCDSARYCGAGRDRYQVL